MLTMIAAVDNQSTATELVFVFGGLNEVIVIPIARFSPSQSRYCRCAACLLPLCNTIIIIKLKCQNLLHTNVHICY